MTTINYTGQLKVTTCWCGIVHAIPVELDREQERNHEVRAYCPVGHSYVRSGPSKVEKDLEATRKRLEEAERRTTRLRANLDQTEASLRATKGHLTRARKRQAAALCPVPGCNRQLVQMERHLHAKHAEWVAEHLAQD